MKAFPTTKPLDSWGDPNAGMDLRDYFAAKALQGYVTAMRPNPTAKDAICNGDYTENNAEAISKASYILADAMMEARKENK
jgi:hypothetical protein